MSSALLLVLQVSAALQTGHATLTGIIRDAESGRPLVGATVTLVDVQRSTRSDAQGLYAFRAVPAGPQHIEVRLLGHAQRTLHALVPHAGQLEINVSLVAVATRLRPVEVRQGVIVASADGSRPEPGYDHSISQTAVRNNPQLIEPDVFLALGGAAVRGQPESPNGLHIRGGAADHTAYLLDGIPVFSPYHSSGMFSAWNPDAITRVDLSGAAPRVTEPHALSGAISATTRTPGERVQTMVTASTSHTRATVDGPLPLAPAGSGFLLSGRGGYPTVSGNKRDDSYTRGLTRDWLGKLETPAGDGRFRLLGYVNENALNTGAVAEASGGTSLRNRFEWTSSAFGASWERVSEANSWRALAWTSRSTADAAWFANDAALGMTSAWRDAGASVAAEWSAMGGTTTLSAQLEHLLTRYAVDSLNDRANNWLLAGKTWLGTIGAEHSRVVADRWRVRAGAAVFGASGAVHASPRAQLQWDATARVSIVASYARQHQLAQSLRNAESVTGHIFPADLLVGAGTPNVPVAGSHQGELRAEYRVAPGARVGGRVYARTMDGLVFVAPVTADPFATQSFAVGSAAARGVTLDFAKSAQRWGVTANYGLQDVQYTLGGTQFTPSYGTRQSAEVGFIVFPSPTSSLRLGAVAEDGRRTTLTTGGFEWEACNLRDSGCEFGGSPRADGGPLGGTSLPRYVRVDIGVQKHWHVRAAGRDALVALFAAITNVAGHTNVLSYVRDPLSGSPSVVEMRPQAPLVVGLDWRF